MANIRGFEESYFDFNVGKWGRDEKLCKIIVENKISDYILFVMMNVQLFAVAGGIKKTKTYQGTPRIRYCS